MAKEPFAAQLTSIWIGGFFFWILKGFKGKLTDQYVFELDKRNLWTGYILELIFVGILVFFLVKDDIRI
ncbi:hypothetical protein C8C83_0181 [Flavobacterium sp. 90]|uniref:hypothetical protein n=1 Tax=unclassified Flavobacterium TaxID=196869 RepID=UPI000EB0B413|nr:MULTISPECIES: hypothetical protein [unclassified Flavobacterium]RKR08598.1 hypothetical protein C8C82_0474 [Flavobacterium sp. 81]TCK52388.1 hypothetical protein C8C83_0181 [Flavobacterium sp. 90]